MEQFSGRWERYGTFLIVTASILILDQMSKLVVRTQVALGQSTPQDSFLRITHVHNQDAAWGFVLPQTILIALPLVAIAAACFLYSRYAPSGWTTGKIGLGMLVGGAAGNVVDRLLHGYVTDFIDVRIWGSFHWPTFNLADAAIVVGTILLGYSLLRRKPLTSGTVQCSPPENST